jgi:PAS domain S-box-containing protein
MEYDTPGTAEASTADEDHANSPTHVVHDPESATRAGEMSDRIGTVHRLVGHEEGEANEINALLVDDDDQWATLLASDIEAEAESITVTTAGSARECLEILQERSDIECVVSDYQMPGQTGIELLETIRETRPRLPFLLVTSQGSETIAARATAAGVTDYLIKDFGGDRATQFVDKIETTVDHYRLRRAIEESEQRYRTVTEHSRDGIAILRYGELLFCNERLVELSGRETLPSEDIIGSIIHPEDREEVRGVFDTWYGDEQPQLHEARIERPDGSIRHCEYTGGRIEYNGEPATHVSIRDVTERKRRERELRWERELTRTVQETLVESRTRERLERQVTAHLQRHGYALAWIGERDGETLVPRAVGGDRRYVERIDRSVADCEMNGEPSVWAAKTGEKRFLQDFADRPSTDWSVSATGYNYRSGAAIPLVYDDITYGVLAVYHDQTDRFYETERRLLTELADTVAFGIHSHETQGALAADQTVDVTVQVTGGYYLVDLARNGVFDDSDGVRVVGTVPLDDEAVSQYVEVDDCSTGPLQDALDSHPDVRETNEISRSEPSRLQVTVTGQTPEAHVASQGVVVNATTIETDSATIEFELQSKEDVRSTVEPLGDRFGTVSVVSINEGGGSGRGNSRELGAKSLTEKQLAALETAYYEGYFSQPRDCSATDVANSLGVSHSTFLRHLRAAQSKLFGAEFE